MTPVNRDREPLPGAPGGEGLETCGKCMGSGYGGHPDSGVLCPECDGSGGVAPTSPVIADQEAQAVDWPQGAEILAKEMQAIVAADRWKGRDLSAVPPEKWSHLRPETQQFWIDTAMRILTLIAAAQEKLHD